MHANDPIHPSNHDRFTAMPGMTFRGHLATEAMKMMIRVDTPCETIRDLAKSAVRLADMIIEEMKKT